MLWSGRTFLPAKPGTFFEPNDFSSIRRRLQTWIWLYRVHLFGHITTVMAFVALATLLAETPIRVVTWPAIAVAAAGLMVAALAGAFYYHFGAWGAIDMEGKSEAELKSFVASLRVSTEYITCLTRFGRVFFGLGQVALGAGLLYGGILPGWLAVSAGLLGLAGMALTMGLPDSLNLYRPLFHLNALWLVAAGLLVMRSGLTLA